MTKKFANQTHQVCHVGREALRYANHKNPAFKTSEFQMQSNSRKFYFNTDMKLYATTKQAFKQYRIKSPKLSQFFHSFIHHIIHFSSIII